MSEKLTILFTPLMSHGNVNANQGLAEALRDRGHRVVFAISHSWRGLLRKYGFDEVVYDTVNNGTFISQNSSEKFVWSKFVKQKQAIMSGSPIEKISDFLVPALTVMFDAHKLLAKQYEMIIAAVKPDIIIVDHLVCSPALTYSGIPWVWFFSPAPLCCIVDDRTPPGRSGLPTNGDRNEWQLFQNKKDAIFSRLWKEVNDYCVAENSPPLPKFKLHPDSPYLNIYMFPEELDYLHLRPLPDKWLQIDACIRTEDEDFLMPKSLQHKPGKWVYVSMGSIACADLYLMKRLAAMLAHSPHKFIVAKGPRGAEYELPDNMWGENILPQTKILKFVDLVITHSGNNTICESLYYGKPTIVLPIFGDQFDIAQRIVENGFGIRLDPYFCNQTQLLDSVESLLCDTSLTEKLKRVSLRIQSSNSVAKAAQMIEQIVEN